VRTANNCDSPSRSNTIIVGRPLLRLWAGKVVVTVRYVVLAAGRRRLTFENVVVGRINPEIAR
jgi:hypothetical protein